MVGSQLHTLPLANGSQRNVLARKASTALVFLLPLIFLLILSLTGQNVFAQPSCALEPGATDCGGNTEDPGSVTRRGQSRHVGNPIDLLTGNKYQRGDDFAAFASPLVYIRHYNSALVDQDIGLGYGWRDTYSLRLYNTDGSGYRLVQSDGRTLFFNEPAADGVTWQSADGFDGSLNLVDDSTIQWLLPDGGVWSFVGSYPVARKLPDGTGLSLNYQNQRLHSVTDDLGAVLQYHYTEGRRDLMRYSLEHDGTQPGHLACLQLPDGSGIRYSYDQHSNLVSAIHSDGVDWRYEYSDERFPSHLTRGTQGVLGATKVATAWGCNDEFAGVTSDEEQNEDVLNYDSTWEYHEDGRASAWHQGDRSVLVDFDVNVSGVEVSSDQGHSTVVRDSSRRRTYRYDYFADEGAAGNRDADVYVRECEECDWDRLVLMESGFSTSHADAKTTAQQDSSTHSSRFLRNRQIRNDLISMGVPVIESRFGSVRIDESDDSSGGSTESWENLTTFEALKNHDTTLTITQRNGNHDLIDLISTIFDPIQPSAPGTCPLPSGMTCAQIEEAMVYADLSACAYDTRNCPNDWNIINPADLGLNPELFDLGAYHAVILYNPATNEFVVSFEGTHLGSLSDWASNAQNLLNTTSPLHYNQAVEAARAIQAALAVQYPNAALSFTGHSLGGGAASIAALAVGAPAVVFNSAAVSQNTLIENDINIVGSENLIDVINVSGDPVTHFQADNNWPALGTHFTIGDYGVDPNIPSHYLETVQLELEQIHRDNCP